MAGWGRPWVQVHDTPCWLLTPWEYLVCIGNICREPDTSEWDYVEQNRRGNHIWYVSDLTKFKNHYPDWRMEFDLDGLFLDIFQGIKDRASRAARRA